jgi:hypothetical protein
MGIRTPGLVIANDALYQLSYTPCFAGVMLTARERFSRTVVRPRFESRRANELRELLLLVFCIVTEVDARGG